MSNDVYKIISEEAQKAGIPDYIPLAIALKESGMNPAAVGDNGTSFGLFQLHRGGLAPSELSAGAMFDPYTNAHIAIPHMLSAYQRGVSQGLSGYDLVAFTANNSAWPGNIGVNSPEAKQYDVGLKQAYEKVVPGGVSSTSGGISTNGWVTPTMSLPNMNGISLVDWVLMGLAGILFVAAFK